MPERESLQRQNQWPQRRDERLIDNDPFAHLYPESARNPVGSISLSSVAGSNSLRTELPPPPSLATPISVSLTLQLHRTETSVLSKPTGQQILDLLKANDWSCEVYPCLEGGVRVGLLLATRAVAVHDDFAEIRFDVSEGRKLTINATLARSDGRVLDRLSLILQEVLDTLAPHYELRDEQRVACSYPMNSPACLQWRELKVRGREFREPNRE